MASIPTKLGDARILQRAGLPLDATLTRGTFSQEYSEHWLSLMVAQTKFMIAVREFSDGPRARAASQWNLVKRRFNGLTKAMRDCDELIGKLSGKVTPSVFKSEQDQRECRMLSAFLLHRAMPFAKYWQSAIEAAGGGLPLTIEPGDSPKWDDGGLLEI
jgi:hypothetical protein